MNRKSLSLIALALLIFCLVGAGGYFLSTRLNKAVDTANIPAASQSIPEQESKTTVESNGVSQPVTPLQAADGLPEGADDTLQPVLEKIKKSGKTGDYSGFVVCIDPGHSSDGGDGRGRVNGTTELEINWEVAHRLKTVLEERYGVQVIMTRSERDMVVGNLQRAEAANNAQADLFFRLHCDWESSGKSSGFTFYYPERQGTAEGATGPSDDVIKSSQLAAKSVCSGTAGVLDAVLFDHGVKTDDSTYIGHQQGGALTGSIHSQVPVVLIEMVYLSNKKDAEFIKSREGQEVMAYALAAGIVNYLDSAQ